MATSPRILIVGAGAVGGYFGARLAQAGRDVTFLVRPKRRAQLERHGLRVKSSDGDFRIAPQLVEAKDLNAPFDVILLSVKAFDLPQAMLDFTRAVGALTLILPVLNGIGHMQTLADRFGQDKILGGVCRVAAELDDDGCIHQTGALAQLGYGLTSGTSSERLQHLESLFAGAGFEAARSTHVVQDMWDKWVQLAALGALNCLMRGTVGAVANTEGGKGCARLLIDECAKVAMASGHPPAEAYKEQLKGALTQPDSALTSSMYRDLARGAPIEADAIIGDLVARGHAKGVAMPLLRAAHVHLQVYQAGIRTVA